jgi:hypothetical protein
MIPKSRNQSLAQYHGKKNPDFNTVKFEGDGIRRVKYTCNSEIIRTRERSGMQKRKKKFKGLRDYIQTKVLRYRYL